MPCWTPAWRRTSSAAWPARRYAKSNIVVVGGEITTKAKLDFSAIARQAIRDIGYVNDDDVFHADKVFVNAITAASRPTSRRAWTPARPRARRPPSRAPATRA